MMEGAEVVDTFFICVFMYMAVEWEEKCFLRGQCSSFAGFWTKFSQGQVKLKHRPTELI